MTLDFETIKNSVTWVLIVVAVVAVVLAIVIKKLIGKIITLLVAALLIFLGWQQRAKVVDFGIAAATAPSGTGDLDAEVLGTPAYLAPERLIDDAVEPASDVYALGVVL